MSEVRLFPCTFHEKGAFFRYAYEFIHRDQYKLKGIDVAISLKA
jgi:hypothetical protein